MSLIDLVEHVLGFTGVLLIIEYDQRRWVTRKIAEARAAVATGKDGAPSSSGSPYRDAAERDEDDEDDEDDDDPDTDEPPPEPIDVVRTIGCIACGAQFTFNATTTSPSIEACAGCGGMQKAHLHYTCARCHVEFIPAAGSKAVLV